jgi:hypothetical protein
LLGGEHVAEDVGGEVAQKAGLVDLVDGSKTYTATLLTSTSSVPYSATVASAWTAIALPPLSVMCSTTAPAPALPAR